MVSVIEGVFSVAILICRILFWHLLISKEYMCISIITTINKINPVQAMPHNLACTLR